MAKAVTAALQTQLESVETSLATCWAITRTDGQQFFFTDHDVDILYGGDTYKAQTGYTASSVETNAGMNVDDLEVEGVLRDDSITETDLLAGRWNRAEVSIFMVNWRDLSQGAMSLRAGWIGTATLKRATFVAELRGLAQKLQQPVGRTTAATCDAEFGDSRCGVNRALFTTPGTVEAATDARIFTTSSLDLIESGDYRFGAVTWTSGDNVGLSMEIRSTDELTGEVQLFLPMPFLIQAGDTFDATLGCNKSLEQCKEYGNVINFRGFPYNPTTDEVSEGPEC